jgi:hypothetical protein
MSDAVSISRELLHAAREIGERGPEVERLIEALRSVEPSSLGSDAERTAFWINVYNGLAKHALAKSGAKGSLLLSLGVFSRPTYAIGAHAYTLDVIEHGILRKNRRRPMALFRTLADGDPRLLAAPFVLDPRIHFALNCGARSCPPIRSYDPDKLEAQLDLATRAYVEGETKIDRERRRVSLPKLLDLYAKDFGDRAAVLAFACRHLAPADAEWIRSSSPSIGFASYDWTIV